MMGNNGRVVHSQGRQIIYNVFSFMKEEKEKGEVIIPLSRLQERVAKATGVGLNTVRRIIEEGSKKPENSKFQSPRKKINKPSPKSTLDEFEEEIVRKVIYNFAAIHKRRPTMQVLFEAVKREGVNFTGKIDSFRQFIRKLGFRWKKSTDNRKILIEKTDIRLKRVEYLRQLKKYKEEGRNIIYCDETYLHSSHTVPMAWDDGTNNMLKAPIAKGRRLIILHAGGAQGFVPNALNIFKSGSKTGDYHDEMNNNNFTKWLKEKFIPNISRKSVLVVDNASYHNVAIEPSPNSSWKKAAMQQWLNERGIFFGTKETKAELYKKINLNKPPYKQFAIDKILAECDMPVLRLPPYHPELNPIEKIWALVKNHVAVHNVTFKLEDVWKLAEDKFATISVEQWRNICNHVEKTEEEYMAREHIMDDIEDFIISVRADESDNDSEFYISSDEENDLGCAKLQE